VRTTHDEMYNRANVRLESGCVYLSTEFGELDVEVGLKRGLGYTCVCRLLYRTSRGIVPVGEDRLLLWLLFLYFAAHFVREGFL